jgi:hypothetical protein
MQSTQHTDQCRVSENFKCRHAYSPALVGQESAPLGALLPSLTTEVNMQIDKIPEPSLLELEEMGRRCMENAPYRAPAPVERWDAKVIPFPTPRWPLDRQRAVAEQALELAQRALGGTR